MNNDFSPAELTHRDVDRFKQYKELLDFYHGRQWSWRASRGEKQLTFNYAKVVIDKVYDRLKQLEDRNIGSISQAEARGDAHLRGAEIDSADGLIRIPANSGQQLYDVIEITDGRAGLDAQKKRVLGLILSYNPGRGEYQHRLLLGAV